MVKIIKNLACHWKSTERAMTTSKETHHTTQHPNSTPTAYQNYHMKKTEDWFSDHVCADFPIWLIMTVQFCPTKIKDFFYPCLRKAQLLKTKLPKPNSSCACHMEPKMQLQQ